MQPSWLCKSLLIGAAIALAAASATQAQTAPQTSSSTVAIAAKKKPKSAEPGAPAYRAKGPHQMACTRTGCQWIPRNCYSEGEVDFRGNPTGFDRIVCQ